MTRMPIDTLARVRKTCFFSARMAEQIDDFRFGNRITSDSDAVRALIQKGLDTLYLDEKQPEKVTMRD